MGETSAKTQNILVAFAEEKAAASRNEALSALDNAVQQVVAKRTTLTDSLNQQGALRAKEDMTRRKFAESADKDRQVSERERSQAESQGQAAQAEAQAQQAGQDLAQNVQGGVPGLGGGIGNIGSISGVGAGSSGPEIAAGIRERVNGGPAGKTAGGSTSTTSQRFLNPAGEELTGAQVSGLPLSQKADILQETTTNQRNVRPGQQPSSPEAWLFQKIFKTGGPVITEETSTVTERVFGPQVVEQLKRDDEDRARTRAAAGFEGLSLWDQNMPGVDDPEGRRKYASLLTQGNWVEAQKHLLGSLEKTGGRLLVDEVARGNQQAAIRVNEIAKVGEQATTYKGIMEHAGFTSDISDVQMLAVHDGTAWGDTGWFSGFNDAASDDPAIRAKSVLSIRELTHAMISKSGVYGVPMMLTEDEFIPGLSKSDHQALRGKTGFQMYDAEQIQEGFAILNGHRKGQTDAQIEKARSFVDSVPGYNVTLKEGGGPHEYVVSVIPETSSNNVAAQAIRGSATDFLLSSNRLIDWEVAHPGERATRDFFNVPEGLPAAGPATSSVARAKTVGERREAARLLVPGNVQGREISGQRSLSDLLNPRAARGAIRDFGKGQAAEKLLQTRQDNQVETDSRVEALRQAANASIQANRTRGK